MTGVIISNKDPKEQKSEVTCPESVITLCYLYPLHYVCSRRSAEIISAQNTLGTMLDTENSKINKHTPAPEGLDQQAERPLEEKCSDQAVALLWSP